MASPRPHAGAQLHGQARPRLHPRRRRPGEVRADPGRGVAAPRRAPRPKARSSPRSSRDGARREGLRADDIDPGRRPLRLAALRRLELGRHGPARARLRQRARRQRAGSGRARVHADGRLVRDRRRHGPYAGRRSALRGCRRRAAGARHDVADAETRARPSASARRRPGSTPIWRSRAGSRCRSSSAACRSSRAPASAAIEGRALRAGDHLPLALRGCAEGPRTRLGCRPDRCRCRRSGSCSGRRTTTSPRRASRPSCPRPTRLAGGRPHGLSARRAEDRACPRLQHRLRRHRRPARSRCRAPASRSS